MSVEDILKSPIGKKLYLKKWQNNAYYPIEIAERTSCGWVVYNFKGEKKSGECFYTNEDFLYKLKNNLYYVKNEPMSDTTSFNLD